MKKLLLLLLCLTICLLAFSGCYSSDNKQSTTQQTTEEPYPEANPASDFEYSVEKKQNQNISLLHQSTYSSWLIFPFSICFLSYKDENGGIFPSFFRYFWD